MNPILDINFYSQNFLKILTKDSMLVGLNNNTYQRQLTDIVTKAEMAGKPVRIIVLKARQLGISTWGTAYLYHKTATAFYRKGVVIAHDRDSTNNLFNMTKRYYDFSPLDIRPMKRYSNEKALVFENADEKARDANPGLLSSIGLETAGRTTAGRSGTIHYLHCSEFAFWPDAGVTVSGLFQSVPLKPGTAIIIESTANGMGGKGEEFYNRWRAAEQGDSDFTPIFFPWFDNSEYEIKTDRDFSATREERDIQKRHPQITDNKINWRRYKIRNELGSALLDPVTQFKQEYPSSPEEAFIASGRTVFEISRIMDDLACLTTEVIEGEFNGNGEFCQEEHGRYKLYEKVKDKKVYAIGGDVAEGLESGDASAMFGIDKDYNQTFSFYGRLDPDLFGTEMCRVGKYYKDALLAPEKNNHGHATVAKIKENDYPNIYLRMVKEERAEKITPKLGWLTNKKTKMAMLDDFVELYRDGILKIKDPELLKEMITLVVEPDGNVILNSKDRVVAACIAIQAIRQQVAGNFKAHYPAKQDEDIIFGETAVKPLAQRIKYYNKRRDTESSFT